MLEHESVAEGSCRASPDPYDLAIQSYVLLVRQGRHRKPRYRSFRHLAYAAAPFKRSGGIELVTELRSVFRKIPASAAAPGADNDRGMRCADRVREDDFPECKRCDGRSRE